MERISDDDGGANIVQVLRERAREQGDAVALADCRAGLRRSLSFSELEHATRAGAALLRRYGLEEGDTVLFFHPVSIELYTGLLSALRAGLVCMFVDPSAERSLISACCTLRQPAAFFGSPKAHLLRVLSTGVRRCRVKIITRGWLPGARRWDPADVEPESRVAPVAGEGPALITFTSGSTGQPKGIVRSHAFLAAQHRALERALALERGQVDLVTLPIFVLANLASGVSSILADTDLAKPGAVEAAAVARQIAREGVCRVAASPAFLGSLLRQRPESLSSLKRTYTGGAPVFPSLMDDLAGASPEANVYAVFGSSEAEPITHIEHREVDDRDREAMRSGKGLLSGAPVDDIRLLVIKDQWGKPIGQWSEAELREQSCEAGETGEIVVMGGHVVKGYLGGRGDEETKFQVCGEVWHRTGDAGYIDGVGRLWLLGRCSAKISVEGKILYPFAVETALSFIRSIHRSAVASIDGEPVVAVEFVPGVNAEDECLKVQDAISWSGIARVVQVARIPVDRRHNAKVDYPGLERLLMRGDYT